MNAYSPEVKQQNSRIFCHPETYILGSSIIGIVNSDRIIDGTKIKPGDAVIGIGSSGPHTNGYTLIRDLLAKSPDLACRQTGDKTFMEAVLEPHRCYYKSIKTLFNGLVTGFAHITGGGIRENLNRILPSNADAVIDLNCYKPQPVFSAIRETGNVSDTEMLRTFNLGVGLAAVCPEQNAEEVLNILKEAGEDAYRIGKITKGSGKVKCINRVNYSN